MPEFEPRRAKAHQAFGYTTAAGDQRELRAGADGIVRPQNDADVAVLDSFDLPVAHPAPRKRPAKPRARPAAKRPATVTETTKPDESDAGGKD